MQSGLPVIPYSSQANGFFAHPYDPADGRHGLYRNPNNVGRWERVQELSRRLGAFPNAVALAFVLCHPAGGQAIVGPRTPDQVRDSCSALALRLSLDDLRFLTGEDGPGDRV